MTQQDSDKVPMAFHDFLAFFSEEEWKLSHKWQKELYKNVMKEIHRALISLGCTIHGTLLRMNGEAEMNIEDLQCSERANSCDPSSNPAANPGMLFRIKQEDDNDFEDQYESEEMEMIAVGSPEGDSDVVFSTEEVEQCHLKGLQGDSSSEDDDHSPDPAIIHPVVQTDIKEEEPSPVYHRDCESSKFLNRPIGTEHRVKKKNFEKSYDEAMQCRSAMGHDEAAKLHAFVDRTPFMNPMLQEQVQQLRREETTQQQSDSNVPTYPNLHQRTTYAQSAGPYSGSECILRTGNISAESDTLQGRIPYTYPESKQDFNVNDRSSGFKGKPTEKGRFPCPGCDKSFSAMSRLRQHERTHTGERPYHCTICGKSFNQKGVLGRHQKIHTGEKPFQCNICGKNFNQKNILIKHQQIHTGERPYQCSVCGKSFNQKGTLNRHETIHMKQRTTSESSVDLILIP